MDVKESFKNTKTLPTTSSAMDDELESHIEKMRIANASGSLKLQFAKIVKPSTL